VTRSEILFFSAGVAAGALAHANYPKLKEALGPLMAGALGDRCAEVARTVAERLEAVQDAMSEMSQAAAAATVAGAAAATADVSAPASASAAARNGKHDPITSPA
jgi:hypothetical protein